MSEATTQEHAMPNIVHLSWVDSYRFLWQETHLHPEQKQESPIEQRIVLFESIVQRIWLKPIGQFYDILVEGSENRSLAEA